ncbi:type IV secretory system conjugative DNA transfer family protein [Acidithrix sp. C25]|uniref:type IV secretory system conjugative DNA transfer family protein n=1 Tax=Acidithrix sp. C25 TaxID=1671482 RepID=UPI00191BA159|nr:type IV secretory system conjugative DNA transfer family protein [Acidithrix sp. C25]
MVFSSLESCFSFGRSLDVVMPHLSVGGFGVVLVLVAIFLFVGDSKGEHQKTMGRFRPTKSSRRGIHEGVHFAGRFNLSDFKTLNPSISIGKLGLRSIRLDRRDSAIVFGPTQSFKTSRLAIPAILEHRGGVIASSVKGDLMEATIEARSTMGRVIVYDPLGSTDRGNSFWNPLSRKLDANSSRRLAQGICFSRTLRHMGEEGQFWATLAARLLAPLLLAASHLGLSIIDVIGWIDQRDFEEAGNFLIENNYLEYARSIAATLDLDERILSSILTTLDRSITPFSIGTTPIEGYFDLVDFDSSGSSSLFLIAPPNRQGEIGTVFGALLAEIFDRIFQFEVTERALLIVLDEAANLAPIANFDEIISTVSSFGVQLITIYQDLAQLRARYGEAATTIVNNHRAKIFLGAISDPSTMTLAQELCGMKSEYPNSIWQKSNSDGGQLRHLLALGALRRLQPGKALLVYGHRPPAIIELSARIPRR